ncbi:MAG: hypothetical protein JSU73_02295 [candidate division WOR-3 bacterium]|nr:MAG: hypothetical protein JSU73_02295 [candidate division WOR-3 bacterium]
MSGAFAGAGVTWVRDSGKFFLMDQGYSGPPGVWKLDPADPVGTIQGVPWQGDPIPDHTTDGWSIVWDPDSNCFWVGAFVDGPLVGGNFLLRYVWDGQRWVWAGTPGDSWLAGTGSNGGGLNCLWIAGMEKHQGNGLYYAAPVHSSPSELNHVVRFDPYAKTSHGRVAHGDQTSERGCALVPYDSNYILTCGWNRVTFCKRDSTGLLLDSVQAPVDGPADWSLHVPRNISPDDTVCVFCMNSDAHNTLQRVSLGMVWSQLVSVGVEEEQRAVHSRQPTATICQGILTLPRDMSRLGHEPDSPDGIGSCPALLDIMGRWVMGLAPGPNDIRDLAPGVYFVREEGPRGQGSEGSSVRKVVIQR